eukprot:gene22930-9319_t
MTRSYVNKTWNTLSNHQHVVPLEAIPEEEWQHENRETERKMFARAADPIENHWISRFKAAGLTGWNTQHTSGTNRTRRKPVPPQRLRNPVILQDTPLYTKPTLINGTLVIPLVNGPYLATRKLVSHMLSLEQETDLTEYVDTLQNSHIKKCQLWMGQHIKRDLQTDISKKIEKILQERLAR